MSAEDFLDTNILVYQLDVSDRRKHRIADRIVRDALAGGTACISWQVVQEWLNVAMRKAAVPLNTDQARAYLEAVLLPLLAVMPSPALYHRALDVHARWRLGIYDALIVAAALTAGCTRLLSEDLQHGQRIETLTLHNPFAAA